MPPIAAYDDIADWYADYVESGVGSGFYARTKAVLRRLLPIPAGPDRVCLDICCGTGAYAGILRQVGWTPIGVDLSSGQLRHARRAMPVARADATALPFPSGLTHAAVCILCHTDLPDYPAVLREEARVLCPGGTLVHLGIHPCFTGAFADRTDAARIIVDGTYHRTERRFDSFTPEGVRARVGAWHLPLSHMLNAVRDAGLTLLDTVETGPEGGVPDLFGFSATKN
jgi:ubiquinone/menaquinone biosynthesis C-methylase UbiE